MDIAAGSGFIYLYKFDTSNTNNIIEKVHNQSKSQDEIQFHYVENPEEADRFMVRLFV